jgi:hypothetical protein
MDDRRRRIILIYYEVKFKLKIFFLDKEIIIKNGIIWQNKYIYDLIKTFLRRQNNVEKDGLIILIQGKLKENGNNIKTLYC